MSINRAFVSGIIAAAVATSAVLGSVEQSAAGKLSHNEKAALLGVTGFIIGATIAGGGSPVYDDYYEASSWERHVQRCYARYRSYDHRTDTYVGYDGYEHSCRL
jgi:hypothetical protein